MLRVVVRTCLAVAGLVALPQISSAANFDCAVVLANREGFVSIRAKPSTSSQRIARAKSGQFVAVPANQPGPWIRVVNLLQMSSDRITHQQKLEGWVQSQSIRMIPCATLNILDAPQLPWMGIWAAEQQICTSNKVVGEDEGLISFKFGEFLGLETSCNITRIEEDPLPESNGVKSWFLAMKCSAEGEKYSDGKLVLLPSRDQNLILVERDGSHTTWVKCTE